MFLISHTCLRRVSNPHLPGAQAFYQANALSTLSTWTSGHTFKIFSLLKYLVVYQGLSWRLGLSWQTLTPRQASKESLATGAPDRTGREFRP
jgi:hypothetical protein